MARVLLVEPDRPIRNFVAGILSDLGHHVAQARSLVDVREWIGRAPFDVVATDLVLGKQGDQVAAVAGDLKIVTLSGVPFTPDEEVEGLSLLDCPFRIDNLKMLATALGGAAEAELMAA